MSTKTKKGKTRQQIWQEKMKKSGKCRICGRPLFNANYCYAHAIKVRDRQREKAIRRKELEKAIKEKKLERKSDNEI